MSSTEIAPLCRTFLHVSAAAYKPLVCKDIIFTSRTIGGHLQQNRAEFFFLTKPNTIREHATLDLLFPTPTWLQFRVQSRKLRVSFNRITTAGNTRITTNDFIRLTT